MKKFLDDNFLLNSDTAVKLYHEYSKDLPIIDYHCHLPPDDIASDRQFSNITEIWLEGDHYKWRAMRANGIDEKYCTGSASPREKFRKWAETVPYTLRNPLYHWTHLELKRYFGIDKLLNGDTADEIYDETREKLQDPHWSVRSLIKRMNVEVLCTTDDPVDSLEHHKKLQDEKFNIKILPTWRADKILAIENVEAFNEYMNKLAEVSDTEVSSYSDMILALSKRQNYFHDLGCRLSDHGLESFYTAYFTEKEIKNIFQKVRTGKNADPNEILKYKTALLLQLAEMDYEKGWTQQFHIGAMRNNNTKMYMKLGADKGFDSIGDFSLARDMSRFFDSLESKGKLAKTILYNLNPSQNEVMATMTGNFNDGVIAGKMQFGSGWWFMDQKDGMERQMNDLSNMGLISHFVGMLTDSRSFMSYPRHEYFRRILCNLVGEDVEKGELPSDYGLTGRLVRDVSYYNAKRFFNL